MHHHSVCLWPPFPLSTDLGWSQATAWPQNAPSAWPRHPLPHGPRTPNPSPSSSSLGGSFFKPLDIENWSYPFPEQSDLSACCGPKFSQGEIPSLPSSQRWSLEECTEVGVQGRSEHGLSAKHCAGLFTPVLSCNTHNDLVKQSFPFKRWANQVSQEVHNLSRVT